MMNYETILNRVIELFATMTESEDEVTAESELIEDLGVSSMDVLILIASLEEEFSTKITEKLIRKVVTVGDMADAVVASLK